MDKTILRAPFPCFGGKSKVADLAWRRFGAVKNYVEPFFGSGAVLLRRPQPFIGPETVNDKDAYVANFWRALKANPEKLAEIRDNPVNECDLEAWHKWLVTAGRKAELAARCKDDPEYHDALIAGRWVWGLCQWIGRGWCCGEWHGPGNPKNRGSGINIKNPEHGGKRSHLSDNGQGVHRQLPHLGDNGQGVHRKSLLDLGGGEHGSHPCSAWFAELAARLRGVRVPCGDWSRVCTPTVTVHHGLTGVFLDPPYGAAAGRDMGIYKEESGTAAALAREWAIANGDDPRLRIALCGHEGEHEMPGAWDCIEWKAAGGYGVHGNGAGRANRHRERIWFSPHCVPARNLALFAERE